VKVYCIISDERAYRSKSPAIFSTVLERMGIKGAYVPFQVSPGDVGQALQSLRILNIAGANVTVPYKETVVPHMDILSEGANIIGAINTIVRNGAELKGYNTNAIGFMDALNEVGFDVEGKSALVFGTGGAAKAAVFILSWLRTKAIHVAGRNADRTAEIVTRFSGEAHSLAAIADDPPQADIIVNATSVSNVDESSEMDALVKELDAPGCELVVDLNYERPDNFWEKMARKQGAQFMDGLKPLAYQARRTLSLWTGLQVPPEAFIEALS
jgi:shikimate dehydrogenase